MTQLFSIAHLFLAVAVRSVKVTNRISGASGLSEIIVDEITKPCLRLGWFTRKRLDRIASVFWQSTLVKKTCLIQISCMTHILRSDTFLVRFLLFRACNLRISLGQSTRLMYLASHATARKLWAARKEYLSFQTSTTKSGVESCFFLQLTKVVPFVFPILSKAAFATL